jgi:hypothetical protein
MQTQMKMIYIWPSTVSHYVAVGDNVGRDVGHDGQHCGSMTATVKNTYFYRRRVANVGRLGPWL